MSYLHPLTNPFGLNYELWNYIAVAFWEGNGNALESAFTSDLMSGAKGEQGKKGESGCEKDSLQEI